MAQAPRLLVSAGDLIEGSAVAAFLATQGGPAALKGLQLGTHAGLAAAAKPGTFSSICSVAGLEAAHSEALCSLLFKLLQPGGTLLVQQAAQVGPAGWPALQGLLAGLQVLTACPTQDTGSLQRQLLFQGFADIAPAVAFQPSAFAVRPCPELGWLAGRRAARMPASCVARSCQPGAQSGHRGARASSPSSPGASRRWRCQLRTRTPTWHQRPPKVRPTAAAGPDLNPGSPMR